MSNSTKLTLTTALALASLLPSSEMDGLDRLRSFEDRHSRPPNARKSWRWVNGRCKVVWIDVATGKEVTR